MRVKRSAGSVVSRLLLSASHSRLDSPAKPSGWISRRLLDSRKSFSIRASPVKVPPCNVSSRLPPMCSSCSRPKLFPHEKKIQS